MKLKSILPGLYMLPGIVNMYLIAEADGYALIDTGFPKSAEKILKAIETVGVAPNQIRHIVLTHGHPDHIGSAAALKKATGAVIYAHADDAPIIEAGNGFRKAIAAPGLRNRIMFKILGRLVTTVEPTTVDQLIADGDSFPFDRDLKAIHIPGHCLGQIALLWNRDGGVLFTADACINRGGMKITAAIEDLEETRRSLAKLAGLKFKYACFGHGAPILVDADKAFRAAWLPVSNK
jgi:glyoxylase-like metal-dependent hydrolase (beta-lactamase superfamily II)